MIFYKDKFRQLRERQNLTLKDVAEAIGVSEGTVQKWEKRTNFQPRPSKIDKIAHVLNCDVSELCNLHDPIPMDGPVYLDERLDYMVDRWNSLNESQKSGIIEIFQTMVFKNETSGKRNK